MMLKSPSRIHITLIDMNGASGRVDGGVGIALDHPSVVLRAEKSDRVEIKAPEEEKERIAQFCRPFFDKNLTAKIELIESIPQHVGLGSGTQVALSSAHAINLLYGLNLSIRELAEIVGRGGTSGIGVAAFERGGLIVDGGHSRAVKSSFLPSSASRVPPPPVLVRYEFPEEWQIVLVLPRGKGLHREMEIKAFESWCPVPLEEVRALSHIILMKLLPSVVERNIEVFGEAINEIQRLGFKRREVEIQRRETVEIMELLRELGCSGSGISSFGPLVYGITEKGEEVADSVREHLSEKEAKVILTKARNRGVIVCG
ncbi:MAG: beta-ribofuranosylaminobenzene 5'-phosphate synthase [Archaeoglobi archaeon]|nr:beta-ribofuranosylaminobenzene 5'-phosphate synthase [Candidatus Mnemosynella bozhongmuii]